MNQKVFKVEDWVYDWRCKQVGTNPAKPLYPIEFINCYRNTILYGNSPKDYRLKPPKGSVHYMPFHKDGVDIRIHTCMWDGW